MINIEFFDPAGALDHSRAHAPRLGTLAGKKIGFISNDQWQAHRTMPVLRAMLAEDFPDAKLLPLDAFPAGNVNIGAAETADLVQKSGVDAVIIGNAA